MSDSYKKQLINNTLWVYVGKIIAQVIGLVATVLVIRKLPVETYGAYTFLFGLFFIYQLFITSPIKNVILRYVPELMSSGSFSVVRKLILYSHSFALLFIVLFSVLLYFCQNTFSSFFNFPTLTLHIKAFVVFVFCYALKVMSETIIASLLKHPISAKANVMVVVLRSSLYIIFLSKITVDILLYIEALVSIVYVAFVIKGILIEVIRKDESISNAKSSNILIKSRILRFYGLSFFTELGYGIIGKTSDQYIIAAISSPFYVGLYGFALKIYDSFYKVMPFREFESVLKPIFFKRFTHSKNDKEINDIYIFMVKVLLPLFMFPVLYFLIFGKGIIIHVFDEKYLPAYWVICVSLVGLIFNGFFYPLGLVIQLKERVEISLYSRIVVVFSIVGGIYAMKYWGIVGVAVATVTGELLKNLLVFFLIRRYIKIKYEMRILSRYGLLLFLSMILFFILQNSIMNIYFIFVGTLGYCLFYLVVLLNVHPFMKNEIVVLNDLLHTNGVFKKVMTKIKPILRLFIVKNYN